MTMLSNDQIGNNNTFEPRPDNNMKSISDRDPTNLGEKTKDLHTEEYASRGHNYPSNIELSEAMAGHINTQPLYNSGCSKISDMRRPNRTDKAIHDTNEHTVHNSVDVSHVSSIENPKYDKTENSTSPEKEFEARLYVEVGSTGIKSAELNGNIINNTSDGSFVKMYSHKDNFSFVNLNESTPSNEVNKPESHSYCQRSSFKFDEMSLDSTVWHETVTENEITPRRPSVDVEKVFKQDEDGDTLLHIAVICLSTELAFYIIDNAPSFTWLNIHNKLFQTPLHLAVLTNQVSLVRRLVVGGARLESRDHGGNMPIHLACKKNRLDCLRALLQPVRYEEQKRNNYDIPFLKIPQNLNSKTCEGLSCLHIATMENYIEPVKVLTEVGADVNIRAEKSGRTILHEAAWSGNLSLVKYLLTLGRQCNINAKTYDDYTAFDLARSRGHWSVVLELATAGAEYENDKDLEV